jgi:acyl carrier protein
MLHAFVGEDLESVKAKVRLPFINYLRQSLDLGLLGRSITTGGRVDGVDDEDLSTLLSRAYDRYFETSALIGTPSTCLMIIENLREAGVDEIACLIDFGLDPDSVMESLRGLNVLRMTSNDNPPNVAIADGLTHLQCTPSGAVILKEAGPGSVLREVQTLLVGGEQLPLTLAMELRQYVSGSLYNMYGPTETTIWSAMYEVAGEAANPPIGRPIANTQLYVLDERVEPVPIGVTGELYIGGDGVTRGYWGRPSLTAERFIADPHGSQPGARLYRTGDLARWRADGNLEFVGRVDQQVKIRGHRIELGEVEAVMGQYAGVRQCAVVVQTSDDDGSGGTEKKLVVFVSGEPGRLTTERLHAHARAKLPDYMVPAAFIRVDALPTTPNGKIDRNALPRQKQEPDEDGRYVAPQTATERALARIWARVLRRERMGATENFFEAGGHSLLAIQVVAQVRKELEVEIPLRTLFEASTVAGLAAAIDRAREEAHWARPDREKDVTCAATENVEERYL